MQSALHASSDDGVPMSKPNVPSSIRAPIQIGSSVSTACWNKAIAGVRAAAFWAAVVLPLAYVPAAYGVMGFEGAWSAIALIAVHHGVRRRDRPRTQHPSNNPPPTHEHHPIARRRPSSPLSNPPNRPPRRPIASPRSCARKRPTARRTSKRSSSPTTWGSPKEIGALIVQLQDSVQDLEIEKWSYTGATTWRVSTV